MHRCVNSTAIAGFGYRHFGPFLLDWFNRLVTRRTASSNRIFMLGRDGWNLVGLFNTFAAMRDVEGVRFIYLQTSRALLSHIALSDPCLQDHAFNSAFDGTVKDFFECRLGIPFFVFDAEPWAYDRVSVPRDRALLEGIFQHGRAQAEAIARESRRAYEDYLARAGVVRGAKNTLSDLGFRGNSQSMLSLLYGFEFEGYYALLDPSGVKAPLRLEPGTTFGLFSDKQCFGSGFAPLDESLLFEVFLTSPYGQVIGIDRDGSSADPFLYRPACGAQLNFGVIAETMQGALKFAYDHFDLVGLNEPIITDFEAFFANFKAELRQNASFFRSIFELDDSFFGSQKFNAETKLWTA